MLLKIGGTSQTDQHFELRLRPQRADGEADRVKEKAPQERGFLDLVLPENVRPQQTTRNSHHGQSSNTERQPVCRRGFVPPPVLGGRPGPPIDPPPLVLGDKLKPFQSWLPVL